MRDRAILLLLLDTGLRVPEAAGIRLGDLRPDGSVKVMGKGAKKRIVPIGATARGAIVRYLGQRGPGGPDAPLFLGRRGALEWRGMQQVLKRGEAVAPLLAEDHQPVHDVTDESVRTRSRASGSGPRAEGR